MARYDRTFLVPYLNDICTLHLSKRKILTLIDQAQKEIDHICEDAISKVEPPQLEKKKNGSFIGHTLTAMILLLIALPLLVMSVVNAIYFVLCILFTAAGVMLMMHTFSADKRADEEIEARNAENEREHYLAQMAAVKEAEPLLSVFQDKIDFYNNEIDRIEDLLTKLYGANVIPGWYRDLYPAVYLDDWFTNSRADDLDVALGMLVLEQIKDKLDVIIRNQAEQLINQRIMIANQERMMEQMERHHKALMSKLDDILENNEERNTYLQMINGHIATSAFFAEASYLRD